MTVPILQNVNILPDMYRVWCFYLKQPAGAVLSSQTVVILTRIEVGDFHRPSPIAFLTGGRKGGRVKAGSTMAAATANAAITAATAKAAATAGANRKVMAG